MAMTTIVRNRVITDDDMLREDIVVVTLEYRSGVLGFLSDGTKYMPGG